MKKKKNVVVNSNVHDKFASTNLTNKLKIERRKLRKKDITQQY